MSRTHPRGQALMIAVLIGAMLLISIPIIIYFNQLGATHQVGSQIRMKARATAEEGIYYAIQILSSAQPTEVPPTTTGLQTWVNAIQPPYIYPPDCNAAPGVLITTPAGGRFTLTCDRSPDDLSPDQINIIATAYFTDTNGQTIPLRAMQAYVSRRTLGADLATGAHAAAALQLVSTPTFNGSVSPAPLQVNWGPIVVYSTETFLLTGPLDQTNDGGISAAFSGFPRKFSIGTSAGPFYDRTQSNSDQKEYWSNASLSLPPVVDTASYKNSARASRPVSKPYQLADAAKNPFSGSNCTAPPPTPTDCGYFNSPGNILVFDSTPSLTVAGKDIFIEGDAEFRDINFDNVNVIVMGNLTLGGHVKTGTNDPNPTAPSLRVPLTAPLEYAYWPESVSPWPCKSLAVPGGGPCPLSTPNLFPAGTYAKVRFRGFLYVRGNLIVKDTGWNLAGAVHVGDFQAADPAQAGTLIIENNIINGGPAGANLTISYDDTINHSIQMQPINVTKQIKIVPDVLRDVPTR